MGEPKNNLLAFKADAQKRESQPEKKQDISSEDPQRSGEAAMVSGVYRLEHEGNHPIQEELLVQKGICLPACAICAKPITYHLVQAVKPIEDDEDFK
jgi:hypothetical protein